MKNTLTVILIALIFVCVVAQFSATMAAKASKTNAEEPTNKAYAQLRAATSR